MAIPQILWPLLNILRAEVGSAQANQQNQGQYNQGASILGLPRTGGPRPGQSSFDWAREQLGNPNASSAELVKFLTNYHAADNPANSLGSQLMGILGQQTEYGNQTLTDMMASGVRGYSDLYGRTQGRNAGLLGGFTNLERATGNRGDAIERGLSEGYGRLGQGFGQRESDVMGLLAGMGATERLDIQEAMANRAAANQAALRSRGLGGSTIVGGQATADERARTRELGALEERLRTQQAGTLANLRGDTLGAMERGIGAQTALGASNLDRMTGMGMSRLGAQERGNTQLGAVQEAGLRNYLGSQSDLANFNLGQYGNQMGLTEGNAARQLGWLQTLNAQGPSTDAAWSGLMNFMAAQNMPQQETPWYGSALGGLGSGAGMALGGLALAPFTGGASLAASAASPFATSAAQGLGAAQLANFGWGWSDRFSKTDIEEIDHGAVLEAVEELPVTRWRYAVPNRPLGPHIGPMAQDFKAAFGLGDDDTTINLLDAFGVALSAIKALSARVKQLEARAAE